LLFVIQQYGFGLDEGFPYLWTELAEKHIHPLKNINLCFPFMVVYEKHKVKCMHISTQNRTENNGEPISTCQMQHVFDVENLKKATHFSF
jgi:hypothetical protein